MLAAGFMDEVRALRARGDLHADLPSMRCVGYRQAWEELKKVAAHADATGRKVTDLVSLVLTDVEMPEMDGYILTKQIKSDRRFAGIPVIMHSSLSGNSNQQLGLSVGVDEYVPKFEPQRLAQTLGRLLREGVAPRAQD